MAITIVKSHKAPLPGGHYSQAVIHNNTVYVSGLLPIKPGQEPNAELPFEEQVALVLEHLRNILYAAGSGMDQVLKVSVFISNIEHWPKVNAIYESSFGQHRPARIVVPTKDLHFGFGIEIDAIAAIT